MGYVRRRGSVTPPVTTMTSGAAVVSKRSRLDGWDTIYSHGGDTKPTVLAVPEPPRSTEFQPVTVQLLFERLNGFLYRSGQRGFGQSLRAGYPSFKVVTLPQQYGPAQSAGPMRPPKRYTRVQRVTRYSSAPRYYRTTPAGKP